MDPTYLLAALLTVQTVPPWLMVRRLAQQVEGLTRAALITRDQPSAAFELARPAGVEDSIHQDLEDLRKPRDPHPLSSMGL